MNEFPTHRHKATGDIVFWGDHLVPEDHELLPEDHWFSEEIRRNKIAGDIVGVKEEAKRRILAKWPIYKQLNAAHEPDEPWVAKMRSEIKAIRDWSNQEERRLMSREK